MTQESRSREFIESICKRIRPAAERAAFRRELADHLDQKVSGLMDGADMSYEEAERAAIEQMGSPREVAKRFNRVHFFTFGRMFKYACLAAMCAAGVPVLLSAFPWLAAYPSARVLASGSPGIGVIGGADGPTAVYVSARVLDFAPLVLFAALAGLTLFAFLRDARGKKRRT